MHRQYRGEDYRVDPLASDKVITTSAVLLATEEKLLSAHEHLAINRVKRRSFCREHAP